MTGRAETAAERERETALSLAAETLEATFQQQQDTPYSESLTKLQLHEQSTNI